MKPPISILFVLLILFQVALGLAAIVLARCLHRALLRVRRHDATGGGGGS